MKTSAESTPRRADGTPEAEHNRKQLDDYVSRLEPELCDLANLAEVTTKWIEDMLDQDDPRE